MGEEDDEKEDKSPEGAGASRDSGSPGGEDSNEGEKEEEYVPASLRKGDQSSGGLLRVAHKGCAQQ